MEKASLSDDDKRLFEAFFALKDADVNRKIQDTEQRHAIAVSTYTAALADSDDENDSGELLSHADKIKDQLDIMEQLRAFKTRFDHFDTEKRTLLQRIQKAAIEKKSHTAEIAELSEVRPCGRN